METFHLLKNPKYAERLLRSIADADAGRMIEVDISKFVPEKVA